MANADRPSGFVPHGAPLRVNPYSAGGTIYPGDAVKLNSSGQVVAASANDALLGVAVGYATSGAEVLVADHPDQQFVAQADEGQIDAQTDIGNNVDIVATSGSTAYKLSRMEIDSSTLASDSTLPMRLLGIENAIDNALGTNARCIVRINKHQLAHNSAGV